MDTTKAPFDGSKLDAFLGKAVGDIGAALSAALVVVGDRLGLYKAMAHKGPMSSEELARATGVRERYVREWLLNQAAGGYLDYHPALRKFSLCDEHAFALADENSPAFMGGAFDIIGSVHRDEPRMTEAFRTGKGVPWGAHDGCLFCGTERFFAANYRANLVDTWIPALEGVKDKLTRGASVADVGCGHGASTILMSQAFPQSTFVGFDSHAPSIECARTRAQVAGLGDRVRFEVADATSFPPAAYELVACFDCLHDMGDPVGCGKQVLKSLSRDGTWLIVEPFASDKTEENLNPVGRVFSAASALICVPASLASDGPALGAQAGPAKLKEVVTSAGFSKFRVATQTPFNLVLEARA